MMFRNASADELSTLLPGNQVYGFAIYQLIEQQFESCCSYVSNQPKAKAFKEGEPQTINFYGDHHPSLKVADFHDWQIKVFVDPEKDFYKQRVHLTRGGEPVWFCDDFAVYFEARELTLRALLHFLKQPKSAWPVLFQCFEVNLEASNEYCFTRDEVNNPESYESH